MSNAAAIDSILEEASSGLVDIQRLSEEIMRVGVEDSESADALNELGTMADDVQGLLVEAENNISDAVEEWKDTIKMISTAKDTAIAGVK